MSKTINSYWIHSLEGSYGVVTIDNGYEKKAYLGSVDVTDTEEDSIKDITDWGAPVYKETLERILEDLS